MPIDMANVVTKIEDQDNTYEFTHGLSYNTSKTMQEHIYI